MTRVDISTELGTPDLLCDIRFLPIEILVEEWDLIWSSPPCIEFARVSMPWQPDFGRTPSTELVDSTLSQIARMRPRWWALENTKLSVKYLRPILGDPRRHGSWIMWGNYPEFVANPIKNPHKVWSTQKKKRNMVSYEISLALCLACETEMLR